MSKILEVNHDRIVMSISEYYKYLKKVVGGVKVLSEETGFSKYSLLSDYLISVVRHGTLIRQYTIGEFWRKSNMERSRCLTYPRMVSYMKKYNNNAYIHYLNEKPHFNKYFNEFVKRDWLYLKEASLNEFSEFWDKHETAIIKPMDGVEGGGIRKLKLADDVDIKSLYAKLKQMDVLIEECIISHPQMVFGNTSVNTIRTMTILDREGKGHVVKAILRAGVGNTVVDNYAQGGSIYEVDVKTGVVNSYGKSKAGSLHIYHPGTDIIMLGYKIPKWEDVIRISEKAAEHLPQVRIVGWDVAITESGVQMIEGNHNPDYELYEYIGSTGYNKVFKSLL